MIRELFKKPKYAQIRGKIHKAVDKDPEVPEGMWVKCIECKGTIYSQDIKKNIGICPNCGYHFPLVPMTRINQVIDKGSWKELDLDLTSVNPLEYDDYDDKLDIAVEKTNQNEAVITGVGTVYGTEIALGVMDSRFMMGSMGSVVGEKITRLIEHATDNKLPLLIFAASGGARMQEGIFSLMQMAKTSSALARHDEAGLLYISFLTNPTTGGVTASFGMLGDIILAEPSALIGFAGPRVIEQTIKQKLPEGFQRAEFLKDHGMIDAIIKRSEIKTKINHILLLHKEDQVAKQNLDLDESRYIHSDNYTPWDSVQIARNKDRPNGRYYISQICDDFIEFHGDRKFGDDDAIVGGVGRVGGIAVTIIAQNKGMDTKENVKNNFGMPHPEGYRKALRLMKQAEKFKRPVICLIDTPGAYCGLEAEERGQGEAIATNLLEMSRLKTPIISIVIGEGGSGGALALGVADVVMMQEHSIYSVLSPEGFASILWKDAKRAKEAAEVMKITSSDLYNFEIIDSIIEEPLGGAHMAPKLAGEYLLEKLERYLIELSNQNIDVILEDRYSRYRNYGKFNI